MSSFYRFPPMKELEKWDNSEQLDKLEEEMTEAREAYFSSEHEIAYGIELMDIIHTAETALRINFNENEIEDLYGLTFEKNKKRGYYDD